MEPINRNINSGEDDNVETLTDNADGNDVGMKFYFSRERADNPPPKPFWQGEDVLQSTNLRNFVKW